MSKRTDWRLEVGSRQSAVSSRQGSPQATRRRSEVLVQWKSSILLLNHIAERGPGHSKMSNNNRLSRGPPSLSAEGCDTCDVTFVARIGRYEAGLIGTLKDHNY